MSKIIKTELVTDGGYANWPNESTYVEPVKDGEALIGWDYDWEIEPITEDKTIQAIWEPVIINISVNNSQVSYEGETIEISYWASTTHSNVMLPNGVELQTVSIQGETPISYTEESVSIVDGKNVKTIRINQNMLQSNRYLRLKAVTTKYGGMESTNTIVITQDASEITTETCQPIVENSTGNTTLSMRIFGSDTYGNVFFGYKSDNGEYDVYFNCGQTFLGVLEKNNTGGLTASETKISIIDDFALIFKLPSYYGVFNPVDYTSTYTITTKNNSSVKNIVRYQGKVDENNTLLLRDCLSNRAIRIPSDGYSSVAKMSQYPYEYASDYFYVDPKMSIMTYINGTFSTLNQNQTSFSFNGFSGELSSNQESGIDYNFAYTIQPNDTCDFKVYMAYFSNYQKVSDGLINIQDSLFGTKKTDEKCVMLQFVQEYDVPNRIYYGYYGLPDKTSDTSKYPSKFDDKYSETSSTAYTYHAWFETCSSKVLTENTTIATNNTYYYIVAYPNDDFEYSVSFDSNSTQTTLRSSYMWGNKSYKVVRLETTSNIIFTRN